MRPIRLLDDVADLTPAARSVVRVSAPETGLRRPPRFVLNLSGRDLDHRPAQQLAMPVPREAPALDLATFDKPTIRGVETIITTSDHVLTRIMQADHFRIERYARGCSSPHIFATFDRDICSTHF